MKKTIIYSALALVVFFISSCSTSKELVKTEPEKSAYEWYNEGVQYYINHNYKEAEHSLSMINQQHPGSIYGKKASLILGDVYYSEGDYLLAIDEYKKFIELYPNTKDAMFAQYKIAMSYYKMMNGYKLDQTPTKNAIENFLILLDKYPNNPYKDQVYDHLTECVKQLYMHQLYITKFYYDLGKYRAAEIELNYMAKHFSNLNFNDEMLYLLASVYDHLGKKQQALSFFDELKKKYPNSKYVIRFEKELNKAGK
ncbi:MAG: outer membrane protein assembly factor BamD [Desulfurella sp.]|uniref:outer membrane protein assembly factor BamD n=1 Tax=Desulfurella sp. TaxID=1962857 RepID=UPI003D0FDF7D